jgi:hypothetical protein
VGCGGTLVPAGREVRAVVGEDGMHAIRSGPDQAS